MKSLESRIQNLERVVGTGRPSVNLINFVLCYPESRRPPEGTPKCHSLTLHDGRKLKSRKGESVEQFVERAKKVETKLAAERAYWVITDYVGGGGNEQPS